MGLNIRLCFDVNNLAGTECYFGANTSGGESHSKFHFTPFQVDEDGMFMWPHHVLYGGRCGTPDSVDGVLVPPGCGVQAQSSDEGVEMWGIDTPKGWGLFGEGE